MSCYIKKQLHQNTSDLFNVSEDLPYNGIVNGIIWNLEFSAVLIFLTFILWSRYKINFFGFVLKGLQPVDDAKSSDWANLPGNIKKWILLDREYLINSCQESGYEYMCYQRYVAAFQLIMCIFGLPIVLVINLIFGTNFEKSTFASTTMSNLHPKIHTNYYWAHIIFSVMIFPGTLFCMKLFFTKIEIKKDVKAELDYFGFRRTLYLSNLPPEMRNPEAVKHYFDQNYPDSNVNVNFIKVNTKISSIKSLEDELETIECILSKCGHEEVIFNRTFCCCRCCIEGDTEPVLVKD